MRWSDICGGTAMRMGWWQSHLNLGSFGDRQSVEPSLEFRQYGIGA
jgi:hypothetical protein